MVRVCQTGISSIFLNEAKFTALWSRIVKLPENIVANLSLPQFRQLPENLITVCESSTSYTIYVAAWESRNLSLISKMFFPSPVQL